MSRRTILVDELHLTVTAPNSLRPADYRSIRRALNRLGFRTALNRAVHAVFRRYPSLAKVRITIAR